MEYATLVTLLAREMVDEPSIVKGTMMRDVILVKGFLNKLVRCGRSIWDVGESFGDGGKANESIILRRR